MRQIRVSSSVVRAAVAALCLAVAVPLSAQEAMSAAAGIASSGIPLTAASLRGDVTELEVEAVQRQPLFPVRAPETLGRPGALLPLYGSLVALQGLDIHSTQRALRSAGATEANPAMRPIVKNSAAFMAVKAGTTVGVIWASEKLWKKHRKTAVAFASLVNVAMAAVVANNYRVNR